VSGLKIYNNVIACNGTDGIILWQSLSGIDIENNILYKNGHWGIGSYDAHGSGVALDHNLSFGNGSGDFDFTDGGSDFAYSLGVALYEGPVFANTEPSSFDAHLKSGSPGIQQGINLYSYFTTDIAGAPRPVSGPWDLGVYVYGTSSNSTTSSTSASLASSSADAPGGAIVKEPFYVTNGMPDSKHQCIKGRRRRFPLPLLPPEIR